MELSKSPPSIHGVLHLPLALGLGVMAMTCLSLLAIGNYWLGLVRVQLALDRCTGETALELRGRLQSLESTNQKISVLRISAAGALAAGNLTAIEAIRKTSNTLARLQDLELLGWKKTQSKWWLHSTCRGSPPKKPLPEIPFFRTPSDPLGAKPLEWRESQPKSFRIILKKGARRSESFVFRSEKTSNSQWTASWRPPDAPAL